MFINRTDRRPSEEVRLQPRGSQKLRMDLQDHSRSHGCRNAATQHVKDKVQPESLTTSSTVACPQCKQLSVLSEGGANQLQTSVVVQELLSTFRALESFYSESGPQCQQCRDEVSAKAVAFCESCSNFICSECHMAHKRWSTYSAHVVTMLKQNMKTGTKTEQEQEVVAQSSSSTTPITQILMKSFASKPVHCTKHPKEKLKFYCSNCKELVCSDCTVIMHRDHTILSVEEALPEHKTRMIQALNALSSFSQLADETAGTVLSVKESITKEASQAKKQILDAFSTLEEVIKTRKEELLSKVNEITFEPLQKLQACSERVECLRGQIMTSQEFLRENMQHNGSTAMLSVEGTVTHNIQQLCNSLQQVEIPQEKSEVLVEFHDHSIETLLTEFGDVVLKRNEELLPLPVTESESDHFTMPTSSSPLPSESQHDTSFLINSFTSRRLVDSLTVRRGSNMFRGQGSRTPRRMSSFVEIEREDVSTCSTDSSSLPCSDDLNSMELSLSSDTSKSNCKILGVGIRTIEGLQLPGGIYVNGKNQNLIVCEFGSHEVNIYDQRGSVLCKIGSKGTTNGQFLYPQKVSITHRGDLVVTDSMNRLQLLTAQGKWLRSVGLTGSGHLQFRDPVGVAVGTNHRFYICERENHRIQVLNQDFSYHKIIGKRGNRDCEFNSPSDLIADGRGFLYIADCWNHRIQVLNEDGVFIREFGCKGSNPGELNWPSHICIDADEALIMVTEIRNHRVSVFQTNGQFVKCFGRKGSGLGQLYKPRGIAMDCNKMIYICDCSNNRIQVFK